MKVNSVSISRGYRVRERGTTRKYYLKGGAKGKGEMVERSWK